MSSYVKISMALASAEKSKGNLNFIDTNTINSTLYDRLDHTTTENFGVLTMKGRDNWKIQRHSIFK